MVEEGQKAGWTPHYVLHTPDPSPRIHAYLQWAARQNVAVTEVSPDVLRAASDTTTPQGILAVYPIPTTPPPSSITFAILLDQLRDPGNVGTILRTAAAARVEAVFLPPGTVDAWSPKVVRAAMGAHFRVPILTLPWDEILASLQHLPCYLAEASASFAYTRADFTAPATLIIGGEADGASANVQSLHPTSLAIPMPGQMESLNAAIAAGILMYEVVRQREIL